MKSEDVQITEKTAIYEFGEFRFDANNLLLARGSETLSLAPKACEVLLALVRCAGRVVSKQEMLETVWSDAVVEEANLTHHISALRKALGEDKTRRKYIETIPRRGYRFVAPVREIAFAAPMREMTITEKTRIGVREEIEISDAGDRISSAIEIPKTPVLTKPISPITRSNKSGVVFYSVVLIVIFAAAALFWFGFLRNKNEAGATSKTVAQPLALARVTNSGKVGAATVSPDGKFVVYSQNYTEGAGALFVKQVDTNVETRLATHEGGTFGTKQFSSDGAFVFYVLSDGKSAVNKLYRVPILGGDSICLLEDVGDSGMFSVSSDNRQAAFFREDKAAKQTALVAAALDGSRSERVLFVKDNREANFYGVPAWSPDGAAIVFPARFAAATNDYAEWVTNVMRFDLATSESSRFTEETWSEAYLLQWMPDASGVVLIGSRARSGSRFYPRTPNQIYFISGKNGAVRSVTHDGNSYGNYGLGITRDGSALVADLWETQGRIWTLDASGDSRTSERLPVGNTGMFTGLAALPDGKIIYSARSNLDYDLWTISETSADEPKPLTSDAFYDGDPATAPDGSFIVFASDRAGGLHLFRANPDGTNVRQLTFGDNFNAQPDVSPDGKWIVYSSGVHGSPGDSPTSVVYKILSDGSGAPIRLTDFAASAPAFSPDEQLISCIVPVDRALWKISIIDAETGALRQSFVVKNYNSASVPARWTPDGKSLIYRRAENQITNLWQQSIAGGAAQPLTDFKSEYIYNFNFTPDRRKILLSRGNVSINVVMIKNFKESTER